MINVSFISVFKKTVQIIKKEPIIIAPLSIFLFISEFFSVFSTSKTEGNVSLTLLLIALNLIIVLYLKGIIFLSSTQVLLHGEINIEKLFETFKKKATDFFSLSLLITLPSVWFSYSVTLSLFSEKLEPTAILVGIVVLFMLFTIFTLFALIITLHEIYTFKESLNRSVRFVISYFRIIMKHLMMIILVMFALLVGFSVFFLVPNIGTVIAVFFMGVLTTLFYVYITVLYHELRHSLTTLT
jgi:hypothetical protein